MRSLATGESLNWQKFLHLDETRRKTFTLFQRSNKYSYIEIPEAIVWNAMKFSVPQFASGMTGFPLESVYLQHPNKLRKHFCTRCFTFHIFVVCFVSLLLFSGTLKVGVISAVHQEIILRNKRKKKKNQRGTPKGFSRSVFLNVVWAGMAFRQRRVRSGKRKSHEK